MMELKFKFEDIFSKEEIKEIAESEMRSAIHYHLKNEQNMERLFMNLTYEYVIEAVDEHLDNDLETQLKTKIAEVISNLSEFSVFRSRDVYTNTPSKAQTVVDEEMDNCRPLITQRLKQIIDEYDFGITRDTVSQIVGDYIADYLFDTRGEK